MSRKSEEEIQAIMEEYRDAPMVNPDKVYPPLPPVQNVTPLVRVPEQMSFTEKIGGTEYTVDAHFRKDGREGESNSIVNQKEYLMKYAKEHGFPNPKFYVDDGYTGTNFAGVR